MDKKQKRFSVSLVLGSLALGQGLRSKGPVTVRSVFADRNTAALPRRNPKIYSSDIMRPWAASMLRFIQRVEARLSGQELESLRIGLCDANANDEEFVSFYERSQLPLRWQSNEALPLKWQCDELIARLVREGKNPAF